MKKLLKNISFLFYSMLLVSFILSSGVVAQVAVCPPQDENALKLMDAQIQVYLTDQDKFNGLVQKISGEHTTELKDIITKIKAGIEPNKEVAALKSVTKSEDWSRLREIVCPYLMGVPATENASEAVIVFNGKSYHDGDEIVVDYDNWNYLYDFELKNYPPTNLWVGWEVFSGSENLDVSVTAINNFPDGAKGDKVKVEAKEFHYKIIGKHGTQKVTVDFKRKKNSFPIKHVWVIDGKNDKRKANESEILYFVTSSSVSRNVKYLIETDARSGDFWPNEPVWKTSAYREFDTDVTYKINLDSDRRKAGQIIKNSVGTTTSSVSAFSQIEPVGVKIQAIAEDRSVKKASLPEPLGSALNNVITGFNSLATNLRKYTTLPIEGKISPPDATMELFNEEDISTRHYIKNRELRFGITGGIMVEGKLPIPFLSYKIPGIGGVGAYIKPGVEIRLEGGTTETMRSETTAWVTDTYDVGGSVTGSVEAGLSVELLPDVKSVKLEAKGYGRIDLTGEVKYSRSTTATGPARKNAIEVAAFLDPLVLGVNVTVKSESVILNMTLIDFSTEWMITDRIEFQNAVEF